MAVCKEYTEYSADELALLLADPAPAVDDTSDGFLAALGATSRGAGASGPTAPPCGTFAAKFAKEHTEFSEAELASLQQEPEVNFDEPEPARQTSDDFAFRAVAPADATADAGGQRCEDELEIDKDVRANSPAPSPDDSIPAKQAVQVLLCKEYTEFSAQELEAVSEASRCTWQTPLGAEVPPCSDDFALAAAFPCMDSCFEARRRPLVKEMTEFSAREMTLVDGVAGTIGDQVDMSSDDFTDFPDGKGKGFFSWYTAQCEVPANGSIQRGRRIYHNRRKTAWTDYDEDGVPSSSSVSTAIPQEPSAVASTLVEMLKVAGAGGPSGEEVRKAALAEAKRGGMGEALRRPSGCGWAPLLVAVQRKQPLAVEELLRLRADVECREPCMGWSPLMYGAASGNVGIVKQLLEGRASVNSAAVRHNWTPLCSAIQSGKADVVRLLIDSGADITPVKKFHPMLAETYAQDFQPAG